MAKSKYFLILLLITVRFFEIKPIGNILNSYSGLIWLSMLFGWMYIGYLKAKKNPGHPLYREKYKVAGYWIVGGIVLSMIPAYLYYGQTIPTSIVAYRRSFIWVFIFVILYMRPNPQVIIKSLTSFSILFFVFSLLKTLFKDRLFYFPYDVSGEWAFENSAGEIWFVGGLTWVLIPLYYYSAQVRDHFTKHALRYMLFLYLIIFLIQNRSTLFGATIILLLMLLTKKSKYRLLMMGMMALTFVLLFIATSETWLSLMNETTSQLDNEDYNRMKAYTYFVYEANRSWITAILGNGFLSSHATSHMNDLFESGIVNSDMGMIGFWNQFGIIPVVVFVYYCVKAIIKKHIPIYVKAIGLHILIGAFTMSYFAFDGNALMFILFYYLYVYYDYYNKPKMAVAR